MDASALFVTLDERGEAQVRIELAQGIWSEPRTVSLINAWLALKDRARAAEDSAKRDAREERILCLAIWANIIATIAAITAIVAIIIAKSP